MNCFYVLVNFYRKFHHQQSGVSVYIIYIHANFSILYYFIFNFTVDQINYPLINNQYNKTILKLQFILKSENPVSKRGGLQDNAQSLNCSTLQKLPSCMRVTISKVCPDYLQHCAEWHGTTISHFLLSGYPILTQTRWSVNKSSYFIRLPSPLWFHKILVAASSVLHEMLQHVTQAPVLVNSTSFPGSLIFPPPGARERWETLGTRLL